jgi:hypothetical protein
MKHPFVVLLHGWQKIDPVKRAELIMLAMQTTIALAMFIFAIITWQGV